MNVLSLCSGVAGLDLGLKIAVPHARTVCYVERDDYCRRVLLARMSDGSLDAAPLWDDLTTFSGLPWQGVVDCVIGGFPCQDVSGAGRREGIKEGNRSGLWFDFARIISEVGPQLVFVENVAALLIRGMDIVLGDLADLGFDAEWGIVSACAFGAPHMRQRVFILAHAPGFRRLRGMVARYRTPKDARRRPAKRCQDRVLAEVGGTLPEGIRESWWRDSEPPVQRMADRTPDRMDRLHAIGNSVVPLQAAAAFRLLAGRLGP